MNQGLLTKTVRNYCFHYVSEAPTRRKFTFDQDTLRRVLTNELQNRTNVQLNTYVNEPSAVTQNGFSVSFDDAHQSVLKYAAPVLAELGIKATLFVPTNFVGTKDFLSWSELETLIKLGWEIGAHTQSHPRMSWRLYHEDQNEWFKRLVDEAAGSKRLLEEHLGQRTTLFAYPFGEAPDLAKSAAKEAGFQAAFSVRDTAEWDSNLFSIPRIDAGEAFGIAAPRMPGPVSFDIVIPAADRPELLEANLKSLSLMTYPKDKFSVLVVFDQPNEVPAPDVTHLDGHFAVHRPQRSEESNNEFRAGTNRNIGARLGEADYVVFLDADVAVHPDYLWALDWVHCRTEDAVVLGYLSGYNLHDLGYVHDVANIDIGRLAEEPVIPDRQRESQVRQCLDNIEWLDEPWRLLYTGNLSVPRSLFLKIGGFDESFRGWGLEDIEFGVRAHLASGNFVFSRFALGYHLSSKLEGPSRNPFRKKDPTEADFQGYLTNAQRLSELHPLHTGVQNFVEQTRRDAAEVCSRPHTVGIQLGGVAKRQAPFHAKLHQVIAGGAPLLELLERVAYAQRVGAKRLWLEGGEPLNHPRLFELLTASYGAGLKTGIRSSLHPIASNPELLPKLISMGVDHVQVLVLGKDAAEHDELLGSGAAAELMTGIRLLEEVGLSWSPEWIAVGPQKSPDPEWTKLFGTLQFLP